MPPGKQDVEKHAEGIDVGGRCNRGAGNLFGSGIFKCHRASGFGGKHGRGAVPSVSF